MEQVITVDTNVTTLPVSNQKYIIQPTTGDIKFSVLGLVPSAVLLQYSALKTDPQAIVKLQSIVGSIDVYVVETPY